MEIGVHLRGAASLLAQAGCDSPRLDAEVLLAHCLGLSRAQLYTRWREHLSAEQEREYSALVYRRVSREPLAYIVGRKEFFGLDFEVDRNVLIPRPETELLVELAIQTARPLLARGAVRIADIGTGSGAIAISLALSLPQATVDAVDRSAEALQVAARNCQRHGVGGRVRLWQGDLLLALPEPASVVVANLPYISGAEWELLAPEIHLFEPASALDGGEDGLDLIRRLLAQVARHPQPPRAVLLEIGATQGQAVLELAHETLPQASVSLTKDYAGHDRIVGMEL